MRERASEEPRRRIGRMERELQQSRQAKRGYGSGGRARYRRRDHREGKEAGVRGERRFNK